MAIENKPLEKSSARKDKTSKKTKKHQVEKTPSPARDVALTDWLRAANIAPAHIRSRLLTQTTPKKLAQAALTRLQQYSWGLSPLRVQRFEQMLAALQWMIESETSERSEETEEPSLPSSLQWVFQETPLRTLHAETMLGAAALATCWPWLQNLDAEWIDNIRNGWIDSLEVAHRLPAEDVDMISWLITHVELPMIFAAWGEDSRMSKSWGETAAQSLHETVTSAKDDAAAWIQSGGRRLRASMSVAIRSLNWCEALGLTPIDSEFKKGFSNLLLETLRWTRKDGSLLLSPHRAYAGEVFDEFWSLAFRIAGRPKGLGTLLSARLPKRSAATLPATADAPTKKLAAPTSYWTNGEAGVMQRDWESHGSRVAVDYSVDPLLLEIVGIKGESLVAGPWSCTVWCDERELPITNSWQEVCWFSEDDVDYLELEAHCDDHCKIQRQILFIREAGIVLLADSLMGSRKANWRIQSTLPLAGDYQVEHTEKTRECWLTSEGKRQALLVPLASGEWRRQVSPHELSVEDGWICVQHSSESQNLYAPLVMAIRREHQNAPLTWRPLTVAENLQLVSPDVAVGYRLQLDRAQWIFYRSLGTPVPRTLLGCHTAADFCACSFDYKTGNTDSLIEVSGADDDEEETDTSVKA
ncbi:MAG: hypothetical protein JNK90_30525 [Planctomycetaceae bacterium]|nr:hypothetical protein [Planctomycetaceae bacterium]